MYNNHVKNEYAEESRRIGIEGVIALPFIPVFLFIAEFGGVYCVDLRGEAVKTLQL